LAERSPEAAVNVSWRGVEYELRNLARRSGIKVVTTGPRSRGPVVARRLRDAEKIPPESLRAVQELYHLRNQAVHTREPVAVEDAKDYVTQAWRLLAFLRELEK
jgi:hypothetical protein